MLDNDVSESAKWYVVHTYSGYENKVKANLEKIVENRGMQDYILDIVVPMEEQIEIKDGKKKATLKKVFRDMFWLK
jgi:transcriptional antiterminator NusG